MEAATTTITEATTNLILIHLKKPATRLQLTTMATIHTIQLVHTASFQATLILGNHTELVLTQHQVKSVPTPSCTNTGHFTENRITTALVKITNSSCNTQLTKRLACFSVSYLLFSVP